MLREKDSYDDRPTMSAPAPGQVAGGTHAKTIAIPDLKTFVLPLKLRANVTSLMNSFPVSPFPGVIPATGLATTLYLPSVAQTLGALHHTYSPFLAQ